MVFAMILGCTAAGSYLEIKYNKLAVKGVEVRRSLGSKILLSFSIPGNFMKLT